MSNLEPEPDRQMSKLYDQGWKKGFKVGFHSGLAAAAGLAVVFFIQVNEFMKRKNNGKTT